jgi:hypothetical protein
VKNRAAFWIFLAFSTLYIATTRGHFVGTDEIGLFHQTRSLWERGDLTVGRILNTFRGRDRRTFSQYGVGQSIAALPLYAIGKGTRKLLERNGACRLSAALAGRGVGTEPSKWGGDVEMFFVNLYNCFVTALLCALFFVFSTRLGAGANWALISTLLLGLTSYVAPFSTGFLAHTSEAFFVLLVFYLLFRDAQEDEPRFRIGAGVAAAVMILFRFQSVIALPALTFYLVRGIRKRRRSDSLRQVVQFILPIVAGSLLHLGVNYLKFETIWGRFNNEGFHTPLLKGLNGFLLSPGDSIFIFTPLLLLAPWTLRYLMRRYRAEALVIVGIAATYVIFYGKYTMWHGLWSAMGPRYVMPIVPLLLLPLAPWMENATSRARLAVIPLAVVGFWVQIVGVAVNWAYLYHNQRWPDLRPRYEFLFDASTAPILAGSRAVLEGSHRVDMWLVNVYRDFGFAYTMAFLLPLFILLLIFSRKLYATLRQLRAGVG